MHGDADYFGRRIERRGALQQILVPITQRPVGRRCRGRRRQRERRRQDVLAEARVRVFAVERIDRQRVAAAHRAGDRARV